MKPLSPPCPIGCRRVENVPVRESLRRCGSQWASRREPSFQASAEGKGRVEKQAAGYIFVKCFCKVFSEVLCIKIHISKHRSRVKRACGSTPLTAALKCVRSLQGLKKQYVREIICLVGCSKVYCLAGQQR